MTVHAEMEGVVMIAPIKRYARNGGTSDVTDWRVVL